MARKAKLPEEQPVASSSRVQLDAEEVAGTGKKRKRGTPENSAGKKRQKKTTTDSGDGGAAVGGSPVKRGRRRDLSLLPTMPFDVVYEASKILAHLTLKDVVSVSRVNREWCSLLCSKDMVPLWKELRLKEGVPEPLPEVTESEWALFLFRGFNCEVCGTKGIQAPDFGIRRRVCSTCKKNKLVPQKRLARDYRQYPPAIADFLPRTHFNGSWMHAYERQTAFFWPDDIHEVGQKWSKLQFDVQNRVPGAQDRAMAYKARREEVVTTIQDRWKGLMEWCENTMLDRSNAKFYASVRRKEEIFKRFRKMGYTDADLRWIENSKAVDQNRDLTERIWKNIQPKLEEELRPRRRNRLVRERYHLLLPAYDTYIRQLKSTERVTVPSLEELLSCPEFDDLAAAPDSLDANSTVITQLGNQLPGMVVAWQEKFRQRVQSRIHSDSLTLPWSKLYTRVSKDDPTILDLAVSAATCVHFPCRENPNAVILGWESAMRHRSCPDYSRGARPVGNAVATSLVQLVGLDPKVATIDDMDWCGHLFLCSTCVNNNWEAPVYTWRQAISHSLNPKFYPGHSAFQTLDREQIPHVFESHKPEAGFAKMWMCNHCAEHYKILATLTEVKAHLESAHDIHKPTFPDDLFAMPVARSWPIGFTLKLWVDEVPPPSEWIPHGRFVCDHCSHCTFDVEAIRKHIADSHDGASAEDFKPRKYWQGWMPPPHLEYPRTPES